MRVLFVSPYIPSRIRVRPYHWIRSLRALGHDVHLVALRPPEDAGASDAEMREVCTGVHVFPLSRGRTLLNAARALPALHTPLQLAYSHHPDAERRVAALAASGRFDVIHVEHLRGVPLVARASGVPIVFDAVDSIAALFAQSVEHAPSAGQRLLARLDLGRSRRFEARALHRFTHVVVTSARDAAAFLERAHAGDADRVTVIPNGVDTEYFRPADRADGEAVVFTGKLSYHANAAAALRLVERVMPLVWEALPDTRVILAGKAPSPRLAALARDPRVTVRGYVEDMPRVLAEAAVAACPLVYGVGIQNKVLEAMACGVPAVITTEAAAALDGTAGSDYLAFASDGDMAQAVVRLLRDASLRARVGAAGRAYVCRRHQWRDLARVLVTTYERATAGASAHAAGSA